MEISRKAILEKTNYGLNIYAHVLRTYYPNDTVLSLSGRDCKPTKNPFNNNKTTLIITIHKGCARHTDTDNGIPEGNAFDFATLHYHKEGNDLLEIINEELNLHIGESNNFYCNNAITQSTISSAVSKITHPKFSYFNYPVSNTKPLKNISLLELYYLIKSDKFKAITNVLRAMSDKKEARKYKASYFDYVTFSGIFSKRNDQSLISHSGLLTIDFDHIYNTDALKASLLKDKYLETELLFVSPSGDGLKWIIPIDLSIYSHQDNFIAIARYIYLTYKVGIDNSGKDISRACFIPHDPEAYINPKYLRS